jgi:hypothetical protein
VFEEVWRVCRIVLQTVNRKEILFHLYPSKCIKGESSQKAGVQLLWTFSKWKAVSLMTSEPLGKRSVLGNPSAAPFSCWPNHTRTFMWIELNIL